jgi:hypothetical protein
MLEGLKISRVGRGRRERKEIRQKYEERGRRFCAGILEQSMRARTTE